MSHSQPQLEMLATATMRVMAQDALLTLEVTQAATGLGPVKHASSRMKDLAKALEKQANAKSGN